MFDAALYWTGVQQNLSYGPDADPAESTFLLQTDLGLRGDSGQEGESETLNSQEGFCDGVVGPSDCQILDPTQGSLLSLETLQKWSFVNVLDAGQCQVFPLG